MKSFFLSLLAGLFVFTAGAQTFDNAAQYMDYIAKENEKVTSRYLSYMSAVSHGRSAKKIEKKRQEVITAISDSRFNVMGMPPYKGDRTLKDTVAAYFKLLNSVFNEDYGKVVNMEEIAEQSYDAMEAYLLAKQKASEKLEVAAGRWKSIQQSFASKNNINLIEGPETALSTKMKVVNEVVEHHSEVYLIFFKCNKQEAYLIDAMSRKNMNAVQQNINSLARFADEGMAKLGELKGYNGDNSLIDACREALKFYKSEADKSTVVTDYFLKEESFTKLKKKLESKSASQRTQQEIDQYNKAVNEINEAGNTYNASMVQLDKERNGVLNDWNKAANKFLDTHIPNHP